MWWTLSRLQFSVLFPTSWKTINSYLFTSKRREDSYFKRDQRSRDNEHVSQNSFLLNRWYLTTFCSCALIFFCFYLFIACLHAEEDDVRRCAGQTSFQVRLTPDFFGLHVVGVQRLDRLLEQSPLDLLAEKQTHKHPGRDVGGGTRPKGWFRCIVCT